MDHYAVPTIPVGQARDGLPSYLEAVRRHLPHIVTRHDRDPVAMVSLEDLRELLRMHRIETEAEVESEGATVNLPQFRIIGTGDTLEMATEDALEKLREYARQYLDRIDFYRHTDRWPLFPLVVRFLTTPEEEQMELLLESEGVEAVAVPA